VGNTRSRKIWTCWILTCQYQLSKWTNSSNSNSQNGQTYQFPTRRIDKITYPNTTSPTQRMFPPPKPCISGRGNMPSSMSCDLASSSVLWICLFDMLVHSTSCESATSDLATSHNINLVLSSYSNACYSFLFIISNIMINRIIKFDSHLWPPEHSDLQIYRSVAKLSSFIPTPRFRFSIFILNIKDASLQIAVIDPIH